MIRHTPVAGASGLCYGQSEVEVDKFLFKENLDRIRSRLPLDFIKIYSSPLSRCSRLAKEFGEFTTDARLMELNFGHWEKCSWETIPIEESTPWMEDFVNQSPPGGETFAEMFSRVSDFMNGLEEEGKILLVTHAGVIRCLWAWLLEMPLSHSFRIPVGYGEVFHFKDKIIISKQ